MYSLIFRLTATLLFAEYICYDDGCHLRKYARNENRKYQTPTAQTWALVEIVIDKMHMSGHVDQWCRANCDPKHFDALQNVSFYNLSIITHCTNVKTFRLILKSASSASPGSPAMEK